MSEKFKSPPILDASDQIQRHIPGDMLSIDLWYPYPNCPENAKFLEVGLMAVRAADSLRISYDFDRDGWKIEQASRFSWPADDSVRDPDWVEVAFIEAWAREREGCDWHECKELDDTVRTALKGGRVHLCTKHEVEGERLGYWQPKDSPAAVQPDTEGENPR